MFKRSGSLVIVAACLTSLAALRAQRRPGTWGPPKRAFLLPNGWVVSPVGEQVPVADLPLNDPARYPTAGTFWSPPAATTLMSYR